MTSLFIVRTLESIFPRFGSLPLATGKNTAAIFAVGLLVGTPIIFAADERPKLPPTQHRTIVIAHRGEHLHHHENTLEAIQGAIEAGADFTEMDVRRSQDGRYVIMHDGSVDRTTDGHGKVADLMWDQLSKLQVKDKSVTNAPPSRIPLFEEALKAAKGHIDVYVDFKAGDRSVAAEIIRANGMAGSVVIYDNASGVAEWHDVAPEMPTITSPPDRALTNRAVMRAFVTRFKPQVLDQAPESTIRPEFAKEQLKFWSDIQRGDENPDYWEKVCAKDIDGFQTDHPAELVQWLEQKGRR